MKKRRGLFAVATLVILSVAVFVGCGMEKDGNADPMAEKTALKVGVTPGPHAEIMDAVKKEAAKDGLKLNIMEFSDYIQPNVALNNGEIDVNSYQHQPFLDAQVEDRGYKIETLAKTAIFPMGIYSKRIKSLEEVHPGAIVAIPNDPSNGRRALLMLEGAGLVKMKENVGVGATAADIKENPKNLEIKELEAAQIPLSLSDVELAVINTNYAVTAGLVPTRDALFLEGVDSPYANILVVRSQDKDNPVYQKFIKAYHSDAVKEFIEAHFKGSGIATW